MKNSLNGGAIVLLSGGIDSTTVLAVAKHEVKACIALTFCYGQKHAAEVEAARRIAESIGVKKHLIAELPLAKHVNSALTNNSRPVPAGKENFKSASFVPETYVPARNTVFLSYALAVAETAGAGSIYTGVSSVDYSGYPDCRPEFIRAFQDLADLATRRAVEGDRIIVKAPLQHLNKAETIKKGLALGVDYSLTLSCYQPDQQRRACGRCDSCLLRRRGFKEAKVEDPTRYQTP